MSTIRQPPGEKARIQRRDDVVVLNATMEPLGVVTIQRALAFLVRERATILEAVPDHAITTAGGTVIPRPRVVALTEYVRVPYRWSAAPWSRRGVLERDQRTCAYCGKRGTTVDHIVPQSRGGLNTWKNTVTACVSCNNVKADQTPAEVGMDLIYEPRDVTLRDTLILAIAQTGADLQALGLAA